jgi:hypothetical protein
MYVTNSVSDTAVVVSIESYAPGMAPALLINHTDKVHCCAHAHTLLLKEITYWQRIDGHKRLRETVLAPMTVQLFAWPTIASKDALKMCWCTDGSEEFDTGLYKVCAHCDFYMGMCARAQDELSSVKTNNGGHVYYCSFLEGRQRVVVISNDVSVAYAAQAVSTSVHTTFIVRMQANEDERLDQECSLALSGFGLALVNNLLGIELAYIGIIGYF